MGVILSLLLIFYIYAAPAVWFPFLVGVPMLDAIGILALLGSIPRFVSQCSVRLAPHVLLSIVFLLYTSASMILAHWVGGVPRTMLELIPGVFAIVLCWINFDTVFARKMLALTLAATLGGLVVVGAWQYHHDPDDSLFVHHQLQIDDNADYQDRSDIPAVDRLQAVGVLNDPNDFAQALLVTVSLLGFLWGANFITNVFLVILPGTLLLYGVYLTKSRGAVVTLAVMAMVFARRHVRWWVGAIVAAVLGVALLAGGFTAGRKISMQDGADRIEIWADGWEMLKHAPVLGSGHGTFSDREGITAHNSFLLVAVELGFVGLIIWVAIFVFCFFQIKQIAAPPGPTPPDPVLAHHARTMEVALTAYLASSCFLSRVYTALPLILVGVVAALATEQWRSRTDLALVPPVRRWLPVSGALSCAIIGALYIVIRVQAR